MKNKIITLWTEKVKPFLFKKKEFAYWTVIAVGVGAFILGSILL